MSFTSKHNHAEIKAEDYPTYQVEYKAARDMSDGVKYLVTWVGSYQTKKSPDRTPYVDVLDGDKHIRVRMPKYSVTEIENIARDTDDMHDIISHKIWISFHPYQTKGGLTTAKFTWYE